MAKKIKVSRKQIKKPDEFITFTDRVVKYLAERKNLAIGIGAGLLLILLLINLASYSYRTQRQKAEYLLAQAFSILNTPLTEELTTDQIIKGSKSYATQKERSEDAIAKFKQVIDKFGKSEPGLEARYHLASLYLEQEDWDNALYYFQDFFSSLEKHHSQAGLSLGLTAYLGMAQAYYGKGEYEKALEYYQKVLDSKDETYLAEASLGKAKTLAKLGKTQPAKEELEKLIQLYPDSIYAQLAELELNAILVQ